MKLVNTLKKIVTETKEKKEMINDNKKFIEIISIIICVISLIGWITYCEISYFSLMILGIITTLYFEDTKYVFLCSMGILFSNNKGFYSDSFPIALAISLCGVIFVGVFHLIKKRKELNKPYRYIILLLFSVVELIPLIWNYNIVPDDQKILYLMFFQNFLYLFLYLFFFCTNRSEFYESIKTFFYYFGLLLAFECIISYLRLDLPYDEYPFFYRDYVVGWGVCNEAGILLLFVSPFFIIKLKECNNIKGKVMILLSCLIYIAGIILTVSKGTILFFLLEILMLVTYFVIKSKYRKKIIISAISAFFIILSIIFLIYSPTIVWNKTIEFVKYFLTRDSGRYELWEKGIKIWLQNPASVIFGSGYVNAFYWSNSFGIKAYVFIVYHCTIIQILASFGIVGIILFLLHIIGKYSQIRKLDKFSFCIILISYIAVDLYGLIDNTYFMWYYMYPLIVFISSVDAKFMKNHIGFVDRL